MPVTWAIQEGAIVVAIRGDYSSTDLERAVSAALYSPDFPLGGALLLDGRDSTAPMNPAILEHRAHLFTALLDHGIVSRCAVVPAPGRARLAREIVRRMGTRAEGVEIFRNMPAAERWVREASRLPRDC